MKYLVTGGTGFVGYHLVKKLFNSGHQVIATGFPNENVPPCKKLIMHHEGDENALASLNWQSEELHDLDCLFHLGANNNTLDTNEEKMMLANYFAPSKLFEDAYQSGCRQFVYASSTAVYGDSPAPYIEGKTPTNPLNVYAKSKLCFEQFVKNFVTNFDVTAIGLRYCNVFGPKEAHKKNRASMIHQIMHKMIMGERPILFKYGWQRRDWIYVEDVVRLNIAASYYDQSQIFNCGSGTCISFNKIIEIINNLLGVWMEPEYLDCLIVNAYQTHTECDMTYAISQLEVAPRYSIERGVKKMLLKMTKAR